MIVSTRILRPSDNESASLQSTPKREKLGVKDREADHDGANRANQHSPGGYVLGLLYHKGGALVR